MSIKTGPNIIIDNSLTLYLDAANIKSYSTGVIWYDLSEYGNNAILSSSNVYNNSNSGIMNFNNTNIATLVTPITQTSQYLTLSLFYKRDEINGGSSWRSLVVSSVYNMHILISFNGSRTLGSYVNGAKSFGYTPPLDEKFHFYTMVYYEGFTKLYVDGIYFSTSSNTANLSTMPIESFGNWPNRSYPVGPLNNILIYMRELSPTEILQNYNALKSRFK